MHPVALLQFGSVLVLASPSGQNCVGGKANVHRVGRKGVGSKGWAVLCGHVLQQYREHVGRLANCPSLGSLSCYGGESFPVALRRGGLLPTLQACSSEWCKCGLGTQCTRGFFPVKTCFLVVGSVLTLGRGTPPLPYLRILLACRASQGPAGV